MGEDEAGALRACGAGARRLLLTGGEERYERVGGLRRHEDELGLPAVRVEMLFAFEYAQPATGAQRRGGEMAVWLRGEEPDGGLLAPVAAQRAGERDVDGEHVAQLPGGVDREGRAEPGGEGQHGLVAPARRLGRADARRVPVQRMHGGDGEQVDEDGCHLRRRSVGWAESAVRGLGAGGGPRSARARTRRAWLRRAARAGRRGWV